jgi:hypothetical protein
MLLWPGEGIPIGKEVPVTDGHCTWISKEKKRPYDYLSEFSCRLDDFKFTTFQTGLSTNGTKEMAFVIEMDGKLYSVMGHGKKQKEVLEMVGNKLIEEAAIYDWLKKTHLYTTNEQHLISETFTFASQKKLVSEKIKSPVPVERPKLDPNCNTAIQRSN